ncbi:MAG TPA: ABC transporter ATP-binding protein [Solirubrobacteraceae bacterium]|nr:ABC transporter ATP-binding protein [Solirubrobacteraceae bacterium]
MTEPTAAPLLEISHLNTVFPTRSGLVRAVNDVSLRLDRGRALGIVGESGSGKSVTMLSVLRLLSPPGRVESGSVRFDGRELLELSEREMTRVRGAGIGLILQDPMRSINPTRRVGDHIAEGLRLHLKLNRRQARARTIEYLGMVGIPRPAERVDDYPHQFSGGMQQRVMIAAAIACEPELLIADEPTTALDVTIQAQILRLIDNLRTELGVAVILITHDVAVVGSFCDEVAVMYAGHVVEQAPSRTLFTDPRHPYTLGLLRSAPEDDTSERRRLVPIPGMPPDLARLGDGCPFAPRCEFADDRCTSSSPMLRELEHDHWLSCWADVTAETARVPAAAGQEET